MRVAIETILWGQRPSSIQQMLGEIKDAGYEGVELWQHPAILGPAKDLYHTLRDLRLCLVGIAGGSQVEKIRYLRMVVDVENVALALSRDALPRVGDSPRGGKPYILVTQWEQAGAQEARANRFQLALYPHMFTPIQTAHEAEQELQRHPELRFLPDVAHLTVAGEDVVEVLKRNYDRLEAIHLKDWTPEFGRAYQFYARGFVELGQGQVDLDGTIEFLKAQRFRGWVVVDQNFTLDPSGSARESRAWLRAHHAV